MRDQSRRKFLKYGGVAIVTSSAGCIGPLNDDSNNDVDNNDNGDNNETTDQPSDEADRGGDNPDENDLDIKNQIDMHLSDTGNYNGNVVNETEQSSVTVLNGSIDGVDQSYAFDPPAIQVDPGTEVTWEWTGGGHSVTSEEEEFDSGIQSGEGTTFSYTFENSGLYRYYCRPHQSVGQKGVVVVGKIL